MAFWGEKKKEKTHTENENTSPKTNTYTHLLKAAFKSNHIKIINQSWTNPGKNSNATPSCSARGSRSFARPRTFSARFNRNIKTTRTK